MFRRSGYRFADKNMRQSITALGSAVAVNGLLSRILLEHFPEKWTPVFRKKMRQIKNRERFPIRLKRKTLSSSPTTGPAR